MERAQRATRIIAVVPLLICDDRAGKNHYRDETRFTHVTAELKQVAALVGRCARFALLERSLLAVRDQLRGYLGSSRRQGAGGLFATQSKTAQLVSRDPCYHVRW